MAKKVVNKKTPKRKLKNSTVILFIGILLLLIPALVFGGIILTAYVSNFNPVIASRYAGDLNPKILDDQLKDIESKTKALPGVEKCEVVLKTSQLRINVDTDDTLDKESIEKLLDDIYNIVDNTISIDTYFTASESRKMYDLSIDVYNIISKEVTAIHYNLTKNSNMPISNVQLLSEPVDEEVVKEIYGETPSDLTNSSGRQEASPDDVDDATNNDVEE